MAAPFGAATSFSLTPRCPPTIEGTAPPHMTLAVNQPRCELFINAPCERFEDALSGACLNFRNSVMFINAFMA